MIFFYFGRMNIRLIIMLTFDFRKMFSHLNFILKSRLHIIFNIINFHLRPDSSGRSIYNVIFFSSPFSSFPFLFPLHSHGSENQREANAECADHAEHQTDENDREGHVHKGHQVQPSITVQFALWIVESGSEYLICENSHHECPDE